MNLIDLTNPHFYITIALSLINATILCLSSYKFFQSIQLAGYRVVGYFYWLKDTRGKYVSRLFMLSFLSLCGLLVTNVLFYTFQSEMNYYAYISLVFYFYFSVVFILNLLQVPQKTPLKYTRRMTRLIVSFFVLSAVITFFLIAFFTSVSNIFTFSSVALTPLIIPILVPLVHFLLTPLEEIIKYSFFKKAKHKLKKQPDLIKIGITGSFGKTSTKYILNTLLSQKYQVCMSPNSFNTPMGLTKVVNKYLKKEHKVLIAEMGAKKVGEIAYLCRFIEPQYGILTAVGSQHLETFLTLNNIKKTKYELIENLKEPKVAVFNGDNEVVKELFEQTEMPEKFITSIENENAFVTAKNLKVTSSGSQFNLCIKGQKPFPVSTVLLGKHNIENILMAVAMSVKLGLTKEQIQTGLKMLVSVPHRLELIKASNGVSILDDSFNASVEGSKSALEVLKLFEANNKVVMTPGLVELGDREKEENIAFAKRIAQVATKCILVNLAYRKELKEGLLEAGFDARNIIECDTLKQAQELLPTLLKPGDVLLIENDLPDNYI
jgi:UDP-N-acetylmuramoyl-tripeptide--D-alanyl-D-alanine ligase